MSEDKDEFLQAEKEYREINNELVIPAYRRFCEELGLSFHFWDELPVDSFDPEIAQGESALQEGAMNLFNRLKPELVLFKDKIVKFQFTSWDGTFTYSSWSIQEFLEQTSDELFYLKRLERRYETVSALLVLAGCFLTFLATTVLLSKFLPWEFLRGVSFWLGLGLGAALYYPLARSMKNIPKRIIDDGRLDGLATRIHELREQLAKVRGSRPDPSRQNRLGQLILQELQETMSPAEIERLVRRLKTRLFLVTKDNDRE
jgi:hypothetical protein